MTQSQDLKTRKTLKFSWELVGDSLLTDLLLAVDDGDDPVQRRREIRAMRREERVHLAVLQLGSPPKPAWSPFLTPVLLDRWLPGQPAVIVRDLAGIVAVGLRTQPVVDGWTKQESLDFLLSRRKTANFRANIRSAFIRAHRAEGTAQIGGARSEAEGPYPLVGHGLPSPQEPFEHQSKARTRLDAMWKTSEPFSTLIVLPTGAGKTSTAVDWLLDRLTAEPELRVLWVAHQQELVVQAIRSFQARAACRPVGLKLNGRAVHAAASPWATLADPDLDVAAVTIQTLTRSFDRNKRKTR